MHQRAQTIYQIEQRTKGYNLYSQDAEENVRFLVKLYDLAKSGVWYIAEYDPQTRIAFGYVTGVSADDEWGYFDVEELISLMYLDGTRQRIRFSSRFTETFATEVIK
jgi:hypothetical protein